MEKKLKLKMELENDPSTQAIVIYTNYLKHK